MLIDGLPFRSKLDRALNSSMWTMLSGLACVHCAEAVEVELSDMVETTIQTLVGFDCDVIINLARAITARSEGRQLLARST